TAEGGRAKAFGSPRRQPDRRHTALTGAPTRIARLSSGRHRPGPLPRRLFIGLGSVMRAAASATISDRQLGPGARAADGVTAKVPLTATKRAAGARLL